MNLKQIMTEQERQRIRESGQDPFALAREAAGLPPATPLEHMIETTRQVDVQSRPAREAIKPAPEWVGLSSQDQATRAEFMRAHPSPAAGTLLYRAFVGEGTLEALSMLTRSALGGVSTVRGASASDPELRPRP